MAMPEATPALIERVDPNWAIEHVILQRVAARVGEPRPLLTEHQHAGLRQRNGLERHRAGQVVDADERQVLVARPGHEVVDGRVVLHVLVPVGHHGSPPVPAATTDDVHAGGQEGVGVPHDGTDVHVVLPVLDGDVERVPAAVEVGDDRGPGPVAVAVGDVAPVAVAQQVGIEPRVVGCRPHPGTDADLGPVRLRRAGRWRVGVRRRDGDRAGRGSRAVPGRRTSRRSRG